ncbi:MAG: hypothetical protein K8I27_10155 [Planctomycetes bacterium]|nr:hypothetical protein [Planctomycetota bacterium]
MKRAILYTLPALMLATAIGFVIAQPDFGDSADKPYEFKLAPDITDKAADLVIEPRFRAVADEKFAYEAYLNILRTGTSHEDGKPVSAFRREENWIDLVTLATAENPIEGNTDLLLRLQFDQLNFIIDNGEARYSGYIGPDGATPPAFKEIFPNGERAEANNIPGWVGITARGIEQARTSQARDFSASAWFSVSDEGRLYNDTYFADFNNPDQRSYPGKLQDPVHLALGIQPEFAKDARVKLGETVTVRRRLPVGVNHGATVDYDVTYKLERLYGTVDEPTAARFSFHAVPVAAEHSSTRGGLTTSFTAPEIKDGALLLDLVKGVAAWTSWKYKLNGKVSEPGTSLATDFEVEVDFSASLRAAPKQPE